MAIVYPEPRPASETCGETSGTPTCITSPIVPDGGGDGDTGGGPPPDDGNLPPVVVISSPLDGAEFDTDDIVTFTATAIDPEDGDVSATLSWVSNHDGVIGTGPTFQTDGLSLNVHTITATAWDTEGKSGSDQVSIDVGAGASYGDMSVRIATFSVDPLAPNDYQDFDLTALGVGPVSSISSAFVRLLCVAPMAGGPSDPLVRNNSWSNVIGVYMYLLDTDTLRVHRAGNSGVGSFPVEVRIELREYIGAASGPWEFIVRDQGWVGMPKNDLTGHQDVVGIVTVADCVPFLTGGASAEGGYVHDTVMPLLEVDTLGFNWYLHKADNVFPGEIGFALVEFTGSNWTIYNNLRTDAVTRDATEQTYTLPGATDVGDWAECMIEGQITQNIHDAYVFMNHLGCVIYPRLVDTTEFHLWASETTWGDPPDVMLHIIRGTGLAVQHIDSVTGGFIDIGWLNYDPRPQSWDFQLATEVAAVGSCWVNATLGLENQSLGRIAAFVCLYGLASTTHIGFTDVGGGDTGTATEVQLTWAAQIAEFPETP